MPHPVTRSDATIQNYRQTFMQLYYRAGGEQGVERIPYDAFVDWLGRQRTGITKRTWWFYKAACLHALDEINVATRQDLNAVIERLRAMTAQPCLAKSDRTSGKKAKRLSQEDLLTLCLYLERRSGVWGARTARWLLAGYATGLRPMEWTDCRWVDFEGVRALQVKNAKSTNGRAHGEHRHLLIEGWDDEVQSIIDTHMTEVQRFNERGRYFSYYDTCRNTLYRAARSCFPGRKRRPSLYTARHQFAADAKQSQSARVAAALMGHGIDKTVQRQYAQARHGQTRGGGGLPPLPLAPGDEVARVSVSRDVKQLLAHLRQARTAKRSTGAPLPAPEDEGG